MAESGKGAPRKSNPHRQARKYGLHRRIQTSKNKERRLRRHVLHHPHDAMALCALKDQGVRHIKDVPEKFQSAAAAWLLPK
jgi:hypothetical protein